MSEMTFQRIERGGICPDCGYYMQPGEVNEHMRAHVQQQRAERAQGSPFLMAVHKLEDLGYVLAPSGFGSVIVNGPDMWGADLTMGQVIDLASARP